MAFVEGGAFKCDLHKFETEDVKEWNEHCLAYPDYHVEATLETPCNTCGKRIYLENYPYQPYDLKTGSKNISLKCDECSGKISQ